MNDKQQLSPSKLMLPYDGSEYTYVTACEDDDDDEKTSKTSVCSIEKIDADADDVEQYSEGFNEHTHEVLAFAGRGVTTSNKFLSYQLWWRCYCVQIWFAFICIISKMMYEIITDPNFATSTIISPLRIGLLMCILFNMLFLWLFIGCMYLLVTGTTMSWSFGNVIAPILCPRIHERYLQRVSSSSSSDGQETLLLPHHTANATISHNDNPTTTTPSVTLTTIPSVTLTPHQQQQQEQLEQMTLTYGIFYGISLMMLATSSAYNATASLIKAVEATDQSSEFYHCVRLFNSINFAILSYWMFIIFGYYFYRTVFVTPPPPPVRTPTTTTIPSTAVAAATNTNEATDCSGRNQHSTSLL